MDVNLFLLIFVIDVDCDVLIGIFSAKPKIFELSRRNLCSDFRKHSRLNFLVEVLDSFSVSIWQSSVVLSFSAVTVPNTLVLVLKVLSSEQEALMRSIFQKFLVLDSILKTVFHSINRVEPLMGT